MDIGLVIENQLLQIKSKHLKSTDKLVQAKAIVFFLNEHGAV